jgi:hypothetical protein
MDNIKLFSVVFLIDNIDEQLCDEIGVSYGSDSNDWTYDQYIDVCDALGLPTPNDYISLNVPEDCDEIEYAMDTISDEYNWLIDSVEMI